MTALSPVLVMLMVGSLVFFLVEVLYAGKYSGRLLYTLFFFVVGRGAGRPHRHRVPTPARASLYGLMLARRDLPRAARLCRVPRRRVAPVIWLARQSRPDAPDLVERHKLTWDCTHIDEKRKRRGPRRAFRRRTVERTREQETARQESGDR